MKKFLCAVMLCVLPVGLLCGCSSSTMLMKTSTNKSAPDFLYALNHSQQNFKNNIASWVNNSEDYGTALKADENASTILANKVWPMVEKANDENLFALLAYNMALEGQDNGFFDVSFLSEETSPLLQSFFIEKLKVDGQTTVYVAKLNGTETAGLNLPMPKASKTDFVDIADTAIKQLGNYLKIEVTQSERSCKVDIGTMFKMPTEAEVTTAIRNLGITPAYNPTEQMVALKYTADGITYTKEVKFGVSTSGETTKTVTRYLGDRLADQTIVDGKEYSYFLETSASSSRDVLWEYELTFSKNDSGLYCQQKQGNHYVWTEYFLAESGEIVGRLKESTLSQRVVVDLLFESNLSSGAIKYNFQRAGVGSSSTKLLRAENVLSTTFCDITDTENTLALNNPSTKVQILKFGFGENITLTYAGK